MSKKKPAETKELPKQPPKPSAGDKKDGALVRCEVCGTENEPGTACPVDGWPLPKK